MAVDYKKISYEISYNDEDYFNSVSVAVKIGGKQVATNSFGCFEEAVEWTKTENERYTEEYEEEKSKEYNSLYRPTIGNKSTVSVGDAGGVPVITPNRVFFSSNESVEYGGKTYDGFYISYNNYDTDIYGCDTTAIVLGQMQYFLVLNGNHEEDLVKATMNAGFDGSAFESCLAYFKEHEAEMSRFSDKVEEESEMEIDK